MRPFLVGLGRAFVRWTPRLFAAAVTLALASSLPAHAYVYRTARGLYQDCAAGVSGGMTTARAKLRPCADYLLQIFNDWNLNQENGVCSAHVGDELPAAYVAYWQARRSSRFAGSLTSADASVREFLDSQKQACPMPDPKTTPP
jgi:hypothetical protein